ncbi:MAG: co-chaperone GroES [Rickettsiales bacterium]|jgi:chaperonin GroES|nr:co-chaperone GroES [Rickettsiales bacterium]
MTEKIKPILDRVVIKRREPEQKTSGGIIIPDNSKDKPSEGIVVAVGSGAKDDKGNIIPMTLKKGDKVLFSKWGGTEFKLNDEELLVMKESDVLCILTD